MLYRKLVTEQLRLRGENKYVPTSYEELLAPPQELRSVDSVVSELVANHGLEVL